MNTVDQLDYVTDFNLLELPGMQMSREFASWLSNESIRANRERRIALSEMSQAFGGLSFAPMRYDEGDDRLPAHLLSTAHRMDAERERLVELPTLPELRTVLLDSVEGTEEMAEYVTRAERLGMSAIPAQQEQFKAFLRREEIVIYPLKEVDEYLDIKAKRVWAQMQDGETNMETMVTRRTNAARPSVRWDWYPLTKKSMESNQGHGKNLYAKPIPLEHQRTVEKIADAFPQAHFFVSQLEYDPDPFMLCVEAKLPVVIAKWNEPGFKLKATQR